MSFSEEHRNVRDMTLGENRLLLTGESLGALGTFDLPDPRAPTADWAPLIEGARRNAERLQTHLDTVSAAGGGIVFFPPGRYYLGRRPPPMDPREPAPFRVGSTTDAPDILVHPNIVLEFAPGAVLVPLNFDPTATPRNNRPGRPDEGGLVIIEIQGAVDAGLHEIFATTLYPRNDTILEPAHRAGKVIFTGNQVREVYPEWWGVLTQQGGHWGVRNRRAFQAAIDAGHTDRYRLFRQPNGALIPATEPVWRQEPTIPVVAMYEYYVEGGLRVGLREATELAGEPILQRANPAPFVMRGGAEPTVNNSTIRALGAPSEEGIRQGIGPDDEVMFSMREVSSFDVEGVSFDGNNVTRRVVEVLLGSQGGIGEFKRCTFMNLRNEPDVTLVTVARRSKDESTAELGAVHVAFTACRMTPIVLNYRPAGELNDPGHFTYATRVRGMLLDYDDDCSVELRACHLQGVCDPMIHAQRGHFAMNESVFHGNRSVQTPSPTTRSSADWRRFWNSTSGTDIFIDRPRLVRGEEDAPASFTARELESQSFQFVSTWMDGDPQSQTRYGPSPTGRCASYVLLNTHHTAAPAGSSTRDESQGAPTGGGADPHPFDAKQFRPSISWEGPGQTGCHLIALGCCLKNTYEGGTGELSPLLGGIRLGPNHTGTIFHIGNTTADPPNQRGSYRSSDLAVGPKSFIRWDPSVMRPGGIREPRLAGFPVEPG